MHWSRPATLAVVAAMLVGCRVVQFPDPNSPPSGVLEPEIALRNIREAYRVLGNRVAHGQIGPDQEKVYIDKLVQSYATPIKVDQVPAKRAWEYADILRQAGRWDDAYKLLQTAVKVASNDDRFVNDSLQLARAAAHLGKVDEAVADCRSTFKVPDNQKAPILMSVLYEVTPEALGKGKDLEVAQLIEDAIQQHEATIVDENTDAGKEFLMTRPHHIQVAWAKIVSIYSSAGREDLARKALDKAEKSISQQARV